MDQNEIAERLKDLRERIRAELEAETPQCRSAGLADSGPAELSSFEPLPKPDEPQVYTTEHLQAANDLAVITAPIEVRSRVPVVGPVLTLLRRLARPFVQPFLDPYLARQEQFNAEIVRHLNENGVNTEARLAAIYGALYERLADSRQLESRLDTALAEYDETLRLRHVVLFDALEEELWAARAHITESGQEIAGSLQEFEARFVHRAQAVDARFDAKDEATAELAGEIDAARAELAVSATRAEVVEMLETRAVLAETLAAARQATLTADADGGAESTGTPFDAPLWSRLAEWMGDQDYRAHQSTFRGAEEEIAARLATHVDRFADAPGPVADLGCGRGEFLALLSEAGIDAIGVEINDADVQECLAQGYEAVHADLFDWLDARETESLGGIFLAQVIEHLPPPQWQDLVRLAASRLAPGGRLLVETINPESLFAMSRAYVIDPTHVRPVHPKLLSFLARRAGFEEVDVHYQAEVSDNDRLLPIDESLAGDEPQLASVVGQLNKRLQRIDKICCRPQEYVLLATRRLS
jgi:O-antigen chain-terminating methyltransferase